MSYEYHREKIDRYLIVIEDCDYQDDNPRDWENLGKMVCWHRRYTLGDEQPTQSPREFMQYKLSCDFWKDIDANNEDYQAWVRGTMELDEDSDLDTWLDELTDSKIDRLFNHYYITLPLYLYDHSGITMNTSGFSCPWDSGQVGFIYVSKADARKEYGDKYDETDIRQYLQGEVQTYDAYLRGETYWYGVYEIPINLLDEDDDELDKHDLEQLDSCGGYYPVLNYPQLRGTPAYLHALNDAKDIVEWHKKQRLEKEFANVSTTGLEE